MKIARFSTILYNVKAQLGLGNVLGFSSDATANRTPTRKSNWMGSMHPLYRRITPIWDRNVSIIPILNQWVEEGQPVHKEYLQRIMKELRYYNQFTHALEISMWMTDKRYFELSVADVAIQLDLIAKAKGVKAAENHFRNIPLKSRSLEVYTALLNCFSYAKSVKKAEATMQKMRDLGLAKFAQAYNCMLNLYSRTGNYDKFDSLVHEMEEQNISHDKYTFGIRLTAYAAVCDVEGIDKMVTMMEADPNVALDWLTFGTASNGYAKVGCLDKALAMLKKSEGLIKGGKVSRAYEFLLCQYAKYGKKDDVLRIWELYKKTVKVYNSGYRCVIHSVLKFDDLESAEKIFEEWEYQNLQYDTRIPKFLIGAYCRKGLLEKAEALINHEKLKERGTHVKSWYYLATGYLENNQTQKAVEAMKEALVIYQNPSKWKPSVESLASCLDYFRDGGDIEGAENFIKFLTDKEIISMDPQDILLNNVQNGESNLDALRQLYVDSLVGDEEALPEPAEDSSDLSKKETESSSGLKRFLQKFNLLIQ